MASPSIRRIERLNYGFGAALVLAALLTQDQDRVLGLAVGVALTCLNFFVLRVLVVKWTTQAAEGKSGNASLLVLPKMVGLMGAVAVIVLFVPIDVIAFLIGYSIFIVSIVVEATYAGLTGKDDSPPNGNPNEPTKLNEQHHG